MLTIPQKRLLLGRKFTSSVGTGLSATTAGILSKLSFTLATDQQTQLNNEVSVLEANGGLPEVWLDSRSVNPDNTASPQPINFGTAAVTMAFVNGTSTNMRDSEGFVFSSASSQSISTNFASTSAITILGKAKIDNITGDKTLVGSGSGAGSPNLRFRNSKLQTTITGTGIIITSISTLVANTFYKVATTRNTTPSWNQYSNFGGGFVTEGTAATATALTSRNLHFGVDNLLGYMQGKMDKVMIYNRELTSTQIQNIFNAL